MRVDVFEASGCAETKSSFLTVLSAFSVRRGSSRRCRIPDAGCRSLAACVDFDVKVVYQEFCQILASAEEAKDAGLVIVPVSGTQ